MIRLNKRSAVNSPTLIRHYGLVDARLDNPHLPARDLIREIRPKRPKPLRMTLRCQSAT